MMHWLVSPALLRLRQEDCQEFRAFLYSESLLRCGVGKKMVETYVILLKLDKHT